MTPLPHAQAHKFVILTLLLLAFAGTLGLGAVWVRQEIFSAANRCRRLEVQLADVTRKADELNVEVATAESVAALLRQNDALRLGLGLPRPTQVVRVEADAVLALAAKRSREALLFAAPAGAPAFAFRFDPSAPALASVR